MDRRLLTGNHQLQANVHLTDRIEENRLPLTTIHTQAVRLVDHQVKLQQPEVDCCLLIDAGVAVGYRLTKMVDPLQSERVVMVIKNKTCKNNRGMQDCLRNIREQSQKMPSL